MGAFDASLGAILIGTLINTYLYGFAGFQYLSYWTTEFNDPVQIKLLVAGLFCADTVHSCSLMYMIWVYLIEHASDPTFVARQLIWPLGLSVVIPSLVAFVTQNFLALRLHRLLALNWLLAFFLCLSTGSMIHGLITGIKIIEKESVAEVRAMRPLVTVWLSLAVILDTSLSAILFTTLQNARSSFNKSNLVVSRLARRAVQSGFITSLFAILSLALFLGFPRALYHAMFCIPICRVYSCTMMDSLLCRKALRGILNDSSGSQSSHLPTILFGGDSGPEGRKEIRTSVRFEPTLEVRSGNGSPLESIPEMEKTKSVCLSGLEKLEDQP